MGFDKLEERMNGTETQEEEQAEESPLESLLGKVDLSAPLEVEDYRGNLVQVPKDKFIQYYMPPNASPEEAFHCMQAVRATGLNLFAPGECYFFKTGEGPVKLFTGYMAYLRKAYAAGLEHIQKPDIDFGDDPSGYPVSCTITIKIKGRDDMEWTTWFSEVAGTMKEGLNKRWKKAPIQMLIKCAIVNILRLSGLVDFTMPYTIDEMDDPVMDGYRTLTQEQLDTLGVEEEPPTPGKVTADYHKPIDEWRKAYHATWRDEGIFADDDQRHAWENDIFGKTSSEFDFTEYRQAFKEFDSGRAAQWVKDNRAKPEPDPPATAKEKPTDGDDFLENSPDVPPKQMFLDEGEKRFASGADLEKWCYEKVSEIPVSDWRDDIFVMAVPALTKLPLLATDDAGQPNTPTDTTLMITPATQKALSKVVKEFPGAIYMTIASKSFRARAQDTIGHAIDSVSDLEEVEAQAIIAALEDEKAAINETGPRVTSENVGEEITEDFVDEGSGPSPPEDPEPWFNSPEFAEQLNAYMIRAAG
ncbi:hypothetical protein LCGC14_2402760, partial [marine sediment metagenome]